MALTKEEKTQLIKTKAQELGFDLVGITHSNEAPHHSQYMEWIDSVDYGSMEYLKTFSEERKNAQAVMPGAKSVISLGKYYQPLNEAEVSESLSTSQKIDSLTKKRFKNLNQTNQETPIIASYARGEDYHDTLKGDLKKIIRFAKGELEMNTLRACVDTAPVLERSYASRAGLGWIGKNNMLINPKRGSYFFISEIFCDEELVYDHPIQNQCGTCTKCLDACPTDALTSYRLDPKLCFSYWTIEHKDSLDDAPDIVKDTIGNHLFGCDICQMVCPYNWNSHQEAFQLPNNSPSFENWEKMNESEFEKDYSKTPLNRRMLDGLRRNLKLTRWFRAKQSTAQI